MRIERQDLSSGSNVITLAEAKEQLRVTHSDHDDYLTALIRVAEDVIFDSTGVLLRRHRLRIFFEPTLVLVIPVIPVFELEKVGYYPKEGTSFVQLAADDYIVLHYGNEMRIAFNNIPSLYGQAMRADVLAGYPSAINDEKAKWGAKLLVGHMYHNNLPASETSLSKIPWSLSMFLAGLRATMTTEVTNASDS